MTNLFCFIVQQTDFQSVFIPEEVINKLHNVELDQPDPPFIQTQKKTEAAWFPLTYLEYSSTQKPLMVW